MHLVHGLFFISAEHLSMIQELLLKSYKWELTIAGRILLLTLECVTSP